MTFDTLKKTIKKIKELEKELTGSNKLNLLAKWRPIDHMIDWYFLQSEKEVRAGLLIFIFPLFLFAFVCFFPLFVFLYCSFIKSKITDANKLEWFKLKWFFSIAKLILFVYFVSPLYIYFHISLKTEKKKSFTRKRFFFSLSFSFGNISALSFVLLIKMSMKTG